MQATIFHVRIFIVIYLIHFNNVNIDILNVFLVFRSYMEAFKFI